MFFDLQELPDRQRFETDLCIIGAGAAGIVIGREFAGSSTDVLMVESGGLDFEASTQDLYRGDVVGEPYYDLTLPRVRAFGGSTNHWTGQLGRLRRDDMELRAGLPHGGWPMPFEEFDSYTTRATRICGGKPWRLGPQPLVDDGEEGSPSRLEIRARGTARGSPRRPGFGVTYRQELDRAANLRVLLHANLLRLRATEGADAIREAEVGTLEGRRATVSARAFVLACGGLENPRLLLLSDDVDPRGLGNRHDLVGRYFQEHPIWTIGEVVGPEQAVRPLWRRAGRNSLRHLDLAPSRNYLAAANCLDFGFQLEDERPGQVWDFTAPPDETAERSAARDLATLLAWLSPRALVPDGDEPPARGSLGSYEVKLMVEQEPRFDNRVVLGDALDALGQRRLRLELGFGAVDEATLRAAIDALARDFGALGIGRLRLAREREEALATRSFRWTGAAHHIGTTRMAESPANGVVDGDCRVHGIDNLWIAGSSVFPVAGYVNPTLTIVALALRLAERLRGWLA